MPETISNKVTTTVTLNNSATQNPLTITSTGTVDVATGIGVLGTGGFVWTIANGGTVIGGNAGGGFGIKLTAGGTVTNGASGVTAPLISGYEAVYIGSATGSVSNFGTIESNGANGFGVLLGSGGAVYNAAGALISAAYTGVDIENQPGTVTNNGAIFGTAQNGAVRLDGGVVLNAGTINGAADYAVVNAGGTLNLLNTGLIEVTGTRPAVENTTLSATIANAGTISAVSGAGIVLAGSSGGTVTNSAGGVISGTGGVYVQSGGGIVSNAGSIIATGTGSFGVDLTAGGTVIDSGTITGGGTAILFGGTGANLLVLEAGYKFGGKIQGSTSAGATNTVELAGSVGGPLTANYNTLGLIGFQDIFFGSGGNATLDITNTSGTPGVTLSDFIAPSETIDLTAIGTNGTISNINTTTDRVTVTGSHGSVTLQFDASDTFNLATKSDGAAGTDLTPVCFCRGTLILGQRGEVPVEALKVGDRVRTLSGELKAIRWIGFGRDLVTRANRLARPIIVTAGALSDGVPTRDLYLTHGHALYFAEEGALIPVEHLVNHHSIRWDERARVVEYYHLELEDHDVVLANGAPAESYYDAKNRALFHNTKPRSKPAAAGPTFAPVLTSGEIVEDLWAWLFARSGGSIETDTTNDPDLHLVADGRRLDPADIDGAVFTFDLEGAPQRDLLLCSRRGVPSLTALSWSDHRPLGVAITEIVLENAGITTRFAYDAPQLREGGCYPAEDGFSWTDGELGLPARFFAGLDGPLMLTVHTKRHDLRYPLRPTAAVA